mgnify:FL=1
MSNTHCRLIALEKDEFLAFTLAVESDDLAGVQAQFEAYAAEKGMTINDTPYYNPPIVASGRRKPSLGGVAMGGNWKGYGIAHHAAASGSSEVLRWALAMPDLEIDTKDWYDATCLDLATDSILASMIRAEIRRRGMDEGSATK